MNEYEEALKTINNEILLCYGEETVGEYESDINVLANAYDLLKKLTSKETPKKPVVIQDDIFGDYHLVCPNCGEGGIIIATRTDGKLYPRCPFCGQKLEGENEDENE